MTVTASGSGGGWRREGLEVGSEGDGWRGKERRLREARLREGGSQGRRVKMGEPESQESGLIGGGFHPKQEEPGGAGSVPATPSLPHSLV